MRSGAIEAARDSVPSSRSSAQGFSIRPCVFEGLLETFLPRAQHHPRFQFASTCIAVKPIRSHLSSHPTARQNGIPPQYPLLELQHKLIPIQSVALKSIRSIAPLLDRVLVQRVKAEAKTAGGIFLPETAVKELNEAKVMAVGPGALDRDGKRITPSVQAGDRVIIPQVSDRNTRLDMTQCGRALSREGDIDGCAHLARGYLRMVDADECYSLVAALSRLATRSTLCSGTMSKFSVSASRV